MKKLSLFLASVFVLSLVLTACSAPQVKDGFYIKNSNRELDPYVQLDTSTMTWSCGGSMAMSYAVSGVYVQRGDRITATADDGTKVVFVIDTETSLTVKSVEDGSSSGYIGIFLFPGDVLEYKEQ